MTPTNLRELDKWLGFNVMDYHDAHSGFRPTTNISDAFEVRAKIGDWWELRFYEKSCHAICAVGKKLFYGDVQTPEEMPLAISIAAKRAKEAQ